MILKIEKPQQKPQRTPFPIINKYPENDEDEN